MPAPTQARRLSELEDTDREWVLIRQCPACGQLARAVETHEPICARGQLHSPLPPPRPGKDIVLTRSYGAEA